MKITSLTLTSQSGKTVTVLSTPQTAEFMHLNGGVEPLTTVSIPQDVYTSASVNSAAYGSTPTCVGRNSAINTDNFNSAITYSPAETVTMPSPITVSGTGMGLTLNLHILVPSSFDCIDTAGPNSITGTFYLTPVTLAASPTNSTNGKATGLRGSIGSVAGNGAGFSVNSADGPTWQVSTAASTVFQGITGAAQLAAGLPVELNAAIQADGSLLATRVEVFDAQTTDLATWTGPVVEVTPSVSALVSLNVEDQGSLFNGGTSGPLLGGSAGPGSFNFNNAIFQSSGQLTNIQSLPFSASFSAANMVPGQNVFITTHSLSPPSGPNYPLISTLTLLPQTINGTISTVSGSGSFTIYTVTLAPYDLFPDFAVQPGQSNLLTNPNTSWSTWTAIRSC